MYGHGSLDQIEQLAIKGPKKKNHRRLLIIQCVLLKSNEKLVTNYKKKYMDVFRKFKKGNRIAC